MIFDLWDTLIDFRVDASRALERTWAERLGADPAEFAARWNAGRESREVGGSSLDALRAAGVPADLLEEFAGTRTQFVRDSLVPRPGAIETLHELRSRGFRLGMISVCSEEIPALWEESLFGGLFDSAVFSWSCRLKKPDPEIYRFCLRELEVEAGDALFVGDGANDELAGAERVGMRAVLIHRPGEEPIWPEAREWTGSRITSIPEVLELV